MLHVDLGAEVADELVRQEALDIDLGDIRIAEIGVARAIGRLGRLGEHMDAVGLAQIGHVVASQHAQDHQRSEPLAVGRAFGDIIAVMIGRDRRHIIGALLVEIIGLMRAADSAQRGDDVVGHLALVEAVAALARDPAQRGGKRRLDALVADRGGVSARQVLRGRVGMQFQLAAPFGPVGGHARRDEEAVLGSVDGSGKHFGQRLRAMILAQRAPGIDGAGHGDGLDAGLGNIAGAGRRIFLGIDLGRGAAGAVQRDRRAALWRIERKTVAADARHRRIDHALHGNRGKRRIDGIAARLQHLHRSERRQRVRGCGHPVLGNGNGTGNGHEVTHEGPLSVRSRHPQIAR